jgi:hypothetical protein
MWAIYKAGKSLRHDRSPAAPKITISGAAVSSAELMAWVLENGRVTQGMLFGEDHKMPDFSAQSVTKKIRK